MTLLLAAVGAVTVGLLATFLACVSIATGYVYGWSRGWWAERPDDWLTIPPQLPPPVNRTTPDYDAVASSIVRIIAGELRRAYFDGQLSVTRPPDA